MAAHINLLISFFFFTSLVSSSFPPTDDATPPPSSWQTETKSSSPLQCRTTCTETVTKTSTSVLPTTVEVIASDAHLINGDDFPGGLAGQTIVYTDVTTSTVTDQTVTVTRTSTPTSVVGVDVTVTVPAPANFLPVQSTLPQATYVAPAELKRREVGRRSPSSKCKTFHRTVTKTRVIRRTSTSTRTLTGDVIIFPVESTAFEYSTFTFNTSYIVIPATTTQYVASTTTARVTTNVTVTRNATTTTVLAACATNNFANYIKQANGSLSPLQNFRWTFIEGNYDTAEACCKAVVTDPFWQSFVWGWGYGSLCAGGGVRSDEAVACSQASNPRAAIYNSEDAANQDVKLVVGNGYCGEFSTATFAGDL